MVRTGILRERMSFRALELLMDGHWVGGNVRWNSEQQAVGVEFTYTRDVRNGHASVAQVVVPGGLTMEKPTGQGQVRAQRMTWHLNITHLLALLTSASVFFLIMRRRALGN
jgi:hypothetical protein